MKLLAASKDCKKNFYTNASESSLQAYLQLAGTDHVVEHCLEYLECTVHLQFWDSFRQQTFNCGHLDILNVGSKPLTVAIWIF
jgi:hypothetical protein